MTNDTIELAIIKNSHVNLSSMSKTQIGEIIHKVQEAMIAECKAKDQAWIKLGMLWSFVVKNKLYKYCGDHIKNANDFLRELDLGIKRRELETYAQIATQFGRLLLERNMQVPIRKLVMIAPLCKPQEEDKEDDSEIWVAKAHVLPSEALKDEIRQHKGLPTKDTCEHPSDKQEAWYRCTHCGAWLKA